MTFFFYAAFLFPHSLVVFLSQGVSRFPGWPCKACHVFENDYELLNLSVSPLLGLLDQGVHAF